MFYLSLLDILSPIISFTLDSENTTQVLFKEMCEVEKATGYL